MGETSTITVAILQRCEIEYGISLTVFYFISYFILALVEPFGLYSFIFVLIAPKYKR